MKNATRLSIFFCFFALSFAIDLTEEWESLPACLFFLILLVTVYLRGMDRAAMLTYLVLSSIYTLAADFPDVGNHNNLYLFCSLFIIAATLASTFGARRLSDEQLWEVMTPPLRVALSLVYIFAGLHKLNLDFFHLESGCSSEFLRGMLGLFRLPNANVPAAAILAAAVFTLVWELGGGVLLWIRRWQAPMLLVSWVLHTVLAMMVFFDFSSLAFALLLTFLPRAQWDLILQRPIGTRGLQIDRVSCYFFLNVLVACLAGIYFYRHGLDRSGFDRSFHRWQGLGLNFGFLCFVWPVVREAGRFRRGIGWAGVPMWNRQVPKVWAVLPLFLIFYGMNPYLGLRTAGTFTMFSNLRTEGETSNHLLFASNPLKFWGYQEDVVEIVELDPRHASEARKSLVGYLLPVVEFKKQIYGWRRAGLTDLAAVYRYDGATYRTSDIVADNVWNVRSRDLEMFLLDFRVIQQDASPNRCRW